MRNWRRYAGAGLFIGFLTGLVEAVVVNRTGPMFVIYAMLVYGILFSISFLVLAALGGALRRNLLGFATGAAVAFAIVLETAFWLNKKSPLPAGSMQSKLLTLAVLAVGIVLGILTARYLGRRIRAAAPLRPMLWVLAGLVAGLGSYFMFLHFESSPGTNFILISVDALRPDHLGCYGYHRETSPNIDRLAAGGAMWRRAFTTCPGSTAGHASMLTGLFPLSHGAYSNAIRLPEEVVTAAEVFRQNGYSTAAFTRNWFISPDVGFGQGFDCFVDDGYGLILGIASPKLMMLGLVLSQTIVRMVRWPGRPSDLEIDAALDWIRSRGRHRFFLFLHIMDAHSPYIPPAEFAGRFGDGDLSRANIQRLHDESLSRRLSSEEAGFLTDRYDEEILAADRKIGLVVAELVRMDLLDKTLIVLLADHGELMDESGEKQFGHGSLDYGDLQIPLIMHLPGVIPVRDDRLGTAQCVDVLPTATAMLGLEDTANRQGLNLLAKGIAGGIAGGIDSIAAQRPAFASGDILVRDEYTVITPRWQYTVLGDQASLRSLLDGSDRAQDLTEVYPAVADSLKQMLAGWMEKSLAEAVVPFSGDGRSATPGQDVRQRLKALGYIQ